MFCRYRFVRGDVVILHKFCNYARTIYINFVSGGQKKPHLGVVYGNKMILSAVGIGYVTPVAVIGLIGIGNVRLMHNRALLPCVWVHIALG